MRAGIGRGEDREKKGGFRETERGRGEGIKRVRDYRR